MPLILQLYIAGLLLFLTLGALLAIGAYRDEDERAAARVITLSPVWFVAVVYYPIKWFVVFVRFLWRKAEW